MQLLFPPVSPFLELIQRARESPDRIILRDHSSGKTATAGQLLQRVASLRDKLKDELLQNEWESASQEKFIFLIAPPGLEYVVSMLTIFSLGAAMSAQCKWSTFMVPRLSYLLNRSHRCQARGRYTLLQTRKTFGPAICPRSRRKSYSYKDVVCRDGQRG